ncbi:hypothetical protein SUDANB140_06312 [Streptomyces sp. enrichment culture]
MHYSHTQKIAHLLRWAAGWQGDLRGESAWSYSLRLGGSHALLNGWMNNPKLMSTLTQPERNLVHAARRASKHSRAGRTLEAASGRGPEGARGSCHSRLSGP